MPDNYIEKILRARVYEVARETPLFEARGLSRSLGNRVLLKREDLQENFSFKCRGAYNRLFHLTTKGRVEAVVAASAGNHAQGVALAAQHLGIKAHIYMPLTTPSIKIEAVKRLGARVQLLGDGYEEAARAAREFSDDKGYELIHPFDDADTIAGQGTIGMEICRQCPDQLDAVFVPIGGGGLAAGIATYIKYLRPEVRLIGVEAEDSASMKLAFERGGPAELDQVGTFAEGVAVRQVGSETYRLCRQHLDEILLVSVDRICAAIKDVFDDTRSLMEPSGALSVAGLKIWAEKYQAKDQTLAAVLTGANVNFDRLRHIAERAEIGENRETLLAVTLAERPGSFRGLIRSLGKRPITEFNYRYADKNEAKVFVGIGGDRSELEPALDKLRTGGYPVEDLTDNDMAKIHVRYMIGGRALRVENERLFRFTFPERPGALLDFLNSIGTDWNISLFHYRNHGDAYGRVLAGVQIPQDELPRARSHFDNLHYAYQEETDNPAYRAFLL